MIVWEKSSGPNYDKYVGLGMTRVYDFGLWRWLPRAREPFSPFEPGEFWAGFLEVVQQQKPDGRPDLIVLWDVLEVVAPGHSQRPGFVGFSALAVKLPGRARPSRAVDPPWLLQA